MKTMFTVFYKQDKTRTIFVFKTKIFGKINIVDLSKCGGIIPLSLKLVTNS